MGLDAPQVLDADGKPATVWTQLRVQLPDDVASVPLTDQHVGPIGNHEPIPTVDVDDAEARLYVRDGLHSEPSLVSRGRWRFALASGDEVRDDPRHLWVEGGIRAGRIYDLVYRAASCPVVGAGLLAVRDLAAFLRSDRPDNPLNGSVDRVLLTGVSQTSRFIRHLLYLGLDVDEFGARAVDGALGLVGGGRRGEFNHRGAQPSVQPTPSFGHGFPFADAAQDDPRTARRDGLLERVAAAGEPPKLIFVDTAAEYWRGDASLAHTHVADGSDIDDTPFVRRYLYAATQHASGFGGADRSQRERRARGKPSQHDRLHAAVSLCAREPRPLGRRGREPAAFGRAPMDRPLRHPSRRRVEAAVSDPVARVARPGRAAAPVRARSRSRQRPRHRPLPGPSRSASRTRARCLRSTTTATRQPAFACPT